MSCKILRPKNSLYLTGEDFEQWQDYFANLLPKSNINQDDLACSAESELKVKNITFVVTEQCNLACTYCYETHKTNKRMTWDVAKKAVDMLFDKEKVNSYYDPEVAPGVILEFIGGEPLLETKLIDQIVEYFKFKAFSLNHPWATNYMISLTSNGILYRSKEFQQFLKRNQGRVSCSLTIDGNKELHDACRVFPGGMGSYDIVEQSVKEWVKNDHKPQTKMTLAPGNVKHLFEATKNLWELGVVCANTNCVFEPGWTTDHAKILYLEMKRLADYLIDNQLYDKYYTSLFSETIGRELTETRNWCGGNGQMLAFGTDGRCFPCIRFMKYSLSAPGREEKPIGDIYRGLEARDENEWLKELSKINMVTQSDEKCISCKIATGCSICTGFNYDHFGDPNCRATYICEMHQARVLANTYYFDMLYQKLGLNDRLKLNMPKDWALNIVSHTEYRNFCS